MALLQIQDKFTIEVPSQNGENEIIEGYLAPVSKQFLKDIKKKYEKQTKEAQKLKKDNNQLIRLNQKIEHIKQKVKSLSSSKDFFYAMINEAKENGIDIKSIFKDSVNFVFKNQETSNKLLDEQQSLTEQAYELSDKVEEASEKMQEFDPFEAKALEHIEDRVTSDKQKRIIELCETYGYALILNTINKDIEEGKQKEEND